MDADGPHAGQGADSSAVCLPNENSGKPPIKDVGGMLLAGYLAHSR